ncbi:hypothetical protein GCM10010232_66390 [Streptomyces amakusaensis]
MSSALRDAAPSQWVDNGSVVTGNSDGPLVGREPSAEDQASPTKEKRKSMTESTGPTPAPKPPSTSRWAARARRMRNEAGLYLLRGAATAVGGALVTYGGIWLHTR